MNEANHSVSPSQISTFGNGEEGCPRKWALEKIDKLPRTTHPSAALGSAVHAQLENYALTGALPDFTQPAGRIAESGLHHWPAFGSRAVEIEREVSVTLDGIPHKGRQDIGYRDADAFGPFYRVGDHKTTSDFAWAKLEKQLRTDPQVLIYGAAALDRNPADDRVGFQWVYMRTKGSPQSRPVAFTMTRAEVLAGLDEHVVPVSRLIHAARQPGVKSSDLPQNPKECGKYGGCTYRAHCNLTPQQVFAAMSALDDIKAKIAAQATAKQAQLQQAANAVQAIVPEAAVAHQPINPPPRPAPGSLLAAPGLPPAPFAPNALAMAIAAPPTAFALPALPAGLPPAPFALPAAPTAPAPAFALPVLPPSPVAPVAAPVVSTPAPLAITPAKVDSFTLYVDCAPVNRTTQSVTAMADGANRMISEATGVNDYRECEFGKGPGHLAGCFAAIYDEETITGELVADSADPATRIVLPYLERRARVIVRATR